MRRLNGVLVLTALIALSGCGSDDDNGASAPSPSPSPSSPTLIEGSVELRFAVNDCEGCVITAYDTTSGREPQTWQSPPVSGGKTVITVPRRETSSMSFDVNGGDARTDLSYSNSRPALVLAERGSGADREANWCWKGMPVAEVVELTVKHRTVPLPKAEQAAAGSEFAHIFTVEPALPVVDGEWQKTADGGLGHQDAPYCNGGSS